MSKLFTKYTFLLQEARSFYEKKIGFETARFLQTGQRLSRTRRVHSRQLTTCPHGRNTVSRFRSQQRAQQSLSSIQKQIINHVCNKGIHHTRGHNRAGIKSFDETNEPDDYRIHCVAIKILDAKCTFILFQS